MAGSIIPTSNSVTTRCRFCKSASLGVQKFNAEIALHFPGLGGLNKPIVWAFPKVIVCLECGFAEFAVPNDSLETLRNPDAAAQAS
jgi:hypothetical protein